MVTRLSLTYTTPISKGTGSISLYNTDTPSTPILTVKVTDSSVTVSNVSTLTLSLPVGLIQYGRKYAVSVDSGVIKSVSGYSMTAITTSTWSFSINPYLLQPLIALINNGALSLEVRKDSSIQLDASSSFDPSSSYRLPTNYLQYDWTCYDVSNKYQSYKAQPLASWGGFVTSAGSESDLLGTYCSFWGVNKHLNETRWEVSDGSFTVDNAYAVKFTISDSESRKSSAIIYIRIISTQAKQLLFSNIPRTRIDANKPFKLNSQSISTTSGSFSLIWTWTSSVSGPTPVFLTPLTGCWDLTVGAGLIPGATYTFTLSYADSVATSSVVVEIEINKPPSGGILVVDNNQGVAMLTLIQANMQGWADSDIPLEYSFGFYFGEQQMPTLSDTLNGKAPLEYLLRGPMSSSSAQLVFPAGQLTLIGYCIDSLGSSSSSSQVLQFSPTSEAIKVIDSANRIDKTVSDASSAYLLGNKILVVGLTASALPSPNTAQVNQLGTTLITSIQVLMDYTVQLFSSARQEYRLGTFLIQVVTMAIEPVTRLPISGDNFELIQKIIGNISPEYLKTLQTAVYTDNQGQVITTTQELLKTRDFVGIAQTLTMASANLVRLSGLLFSKANVYYTTAATILQLNGQVSEEARRLITPDIVTHTQQIPPSDIMSTTINLSKNVNITFPEFTTTAKQVNINASAFSFNPFHDSTVMSLNTLVSVGVVPVNSQDTIDLDFLISPVLLNFSLTKVEITSIAKKLSQSSGFLQGIRPDCTYWNYNESRFSPEGCGINNVIEVYEYFEDFELMPGEFVLQCACYHLSEFTVSFSSKATLQGPVYMLRDRHQTSFHLSMWESTLLLIIYFSLLALFFVTLSCAFYWDNFNPHFSGPSVEAEKSFRYFDHGKVQAVLSQLEREFIKRLSQDKTDSKVFISKILHSGLVGRLMTVFNDDSVDELYRNQPNELHPMQVFMRNLDGLGDESDRVLDESPIDRPFSPSNPMRVQQADLPSRLRGYLNKGIGDPRFICTPVIMEDENMFEKEEFPIPTQRDEQETMDQLKHRLYVLDVGSQEKTPVDQFLEQYDDFSKLQDFAQQHFIGKDRPLTESDMAQLGYGELDFAAVRFTSQGLVPDTTRLTGGEYAKKLVSEVKKFYYTVKVSYWSLCKLYFQKEHKLVALIYTLHVEYTKKQMLTFLFLHQLLNLMLCALYTSYFNWNFNKEYTENGACYWGCSHEAQMIAGTLCAWLPWPLVYLTKYLFAKNVVDFGATNAWK